MVWRRFSPGTAPWAKFVAVKVIDPEPVVTLGAALVTTGARMVTTSPATVAEYPAIVQFAEIVLVQLLMFVRMREATSLGNVEAVVVPESISFPPTVMLLTLVFVEPLTVMVALRGDAMRGKL